MSAMVSLNDAGGDAFRTSRLELLKRVFEFESGATWCHAASDLADKLLLGIFEELQEEFPKLPPISLVATGGYGRRELAPYSDIDLTVVPLEESDPNLDRAIRFLFNRIHSAFGGSGVDVGYNYRLIADAPALDAKTRTGLIDARFVAGNTSPYENLLEAFWKMFPVGEFIVAKTEERRAAIGRASDSPFCIEPHLKEGAGGLRCFQVSNWIREAIGMRAIGPTSSYDVILRIRNQLHSLSGRKTDLLNRNRQGELAERLGTHPNELLAQVSAALEANAATLNDTLDSLQEARYPLSESVFALRGEARIEQGAPPADAAFGIAVATQLGLRVEPDTTRYDTDIRGPQALVALSRGEKTIRNLDRGGVLQVLLPEFTAMRYVMPSDIAHSHSVYEHTLRAIRVFDQTESGSGFFADLKDSIRAHGPFVLALLLHDVGKGVSEPQHAELGSAVARRVAKRWNLDRDIADLVSWLIAEHLTMATMARMRDVEHPTTAKELARIVKTQERLDHLTLLTYCDAMAVGVGNFTSTQELFLRELYGRTLEVLRGKQQPIDDSNVRRRIAKSIAKSNYSESEVTQFIESLPAQYLLTTSEPVIHEHYAYSLAAQSGETIVEVESPRDLDISDVTICCLDEPGLLSRALGVFYAMDLSLVSLRACTTNADPAIAIDVFSLTHGGKQIPPSTANRIRAVMPEILTGEASLDEFIKKSGKNPTHSQQIMSHKFIEGDPGILEFHAPRGRGLAYRLSSILADNGINILSARGSQWAGKGVVTFYVEGPNHQRLQKAAIDEIMNRLV